MARFERTTHLAIPAFLAIVVVVVVVVTVVRRPTDGALDEVAGRAAQVEWLVTDEPPNALDEAISSLALELDAILLPVAQVSSGVLAQVKPPVTPRRSRNPDAHGALRFDPVVELDAELVELALEIAGEIDPKLADQLKALQRIDPENFAKKIRQSRRLMALAELKRRDEPLYKLKIVEVRTDAEVALVAAKARRAIEEGRHEEARQYEAQLQIHVALQLAFRYRAREAYAKKICTKLDELERDLQYEIEHFEEVRATRIDKLLGRSGPSS